MKCISTRGDAAPVTIDEAIAAGLAPDGGLYVPEHVPALLLPLPLAGPDGSFANHRFASRSAPERSEGRGLLGEAKPNLAAGWGEGKDAADRVGQSPISALIRPSGTSLRAPALRSAQGVQASASQWLASDTPSPRKREKGALADTALAVLTPFFTDSALRDALPELCGDAFDFPASLRALATPNDYLLELFHGPTAAFKDYAARFLASALARLRDPQAGTTTVLVATSGDTGAAVAAAFHRRAGFRVVVLYPDGRVSPRQAHVLGSFGDNVQALRVAGSFDDCQRLVKQALADPALRAQRTLTSANSISLGRLLPQVAYYAHAALQHRVDHGQPLGFVIPTGNLGNALACWLARRMGLPIGDIVLACNANDALPRYFDGGDYAPQPTRATLANAMDVGAPSNFERLRFWHENDDALRDGMRAICVDDDTIRRTIAQAPERSGIVPCPHTAVGLQVLAQLRAAGDARPWAVVATAHPAKFDSTVEPLVGHAIEPPAALATALAQPAHATALAADYAALREQLLAD